MDTSTKVKPNLFIVGTGKAGTFALYEYLSQHPDVYMSSMKEPNFFGRDLKFRVPRIKQNEYINLFSKGVDRKYRGEASVSYLLSATSAQEIRDFNQDAKIVIMVRNPIEIIHARHAQNLLKGTETITDLEQALNAEIDRRNGKNIPNCTPIVDWLFYREWARQATQVERYLTAFGKEDVFIGVFDDFKDDPAGLYMKLLGFLGLDKIPPRNFSRINSRMRPRSYRLSQFLHGRKSAWRLAITKILIPNQHLRKLLRATIVKFNEKPVVVKELPIFLKKRLEKEYEEEVANLGRIIKRDLSIWVSK